MDTLDYTVEPIIITPITDECPGCGALDGEPCTLWCDDVWGGIVKNTYRRPTWDGER